MKKIKDKTGEGIDTEFSNICSNIFDLLRNFHRGQVTASGS